MYWKKLEWGFGKGEWRTKQWEKDDIVIFDWCTVIMIGSWSFNSTDYDKTWFL